MTAALIDAISGWFAGLPFSKPDAFALDPIGSEEQDDASGRFDPSLSPLDEFH